jgi:hypothetical protein
MLVVSLNEFSHDLGPRPSLSPNVNRADLLTTNKDIEGRRRKQIRSSQ